MIFLKKLDLEKNGVNRFKVACDRREALLLLMEVQQRSSNSIKG